MLKTLSIYIPLIILMRNNALRLTDFYKTTKMKLRLVLVVLLSLPLLAKGQSAPKTEAKSGVIFYSKGQMYVSYGEKAPTGTAASTSLYIDGSAKFVTGSSIDQKGRTELTGDFINGKNPNEEAAASANLFVNLGATPTATEGVVAFVGKPTINGGSARQWIYGVKNQIGGVDDNWNGKSQKAFNFMRFPTISVEKDDPTLLTNADWRYNSLVTIDPSAAVEVNYIDVDVTKKNRLGVLAQYKTDATNNVINSGHLLIHNLAPTLSSNVLGRSTYSQVDLEMYKYDGTNDDGAFDNESAEKPNPSPSTFGKTLRNPEGWNYLTGFASPFEELGSDYMFYHALAKPNKFSITSNKGPIVDPFFRMKKGEAYFMSMEVSHADHKDHIDIRWDFEDDKGATGIHNTKRARGGYVFNRRVFHDFLSSPTVVAATNEGSMDNFSRFLYNKFENADGTGARVFNDNGTYANPSFAVHGDTDKPVGGLGKTVWMENGKDRSRYELMENETFTLGDVTLALTDGLNFIGNPFMVPITLNPLLGLNKDGSDKGFTDDKLKEAFEIDELGSGLKASTESMTGVNLRAKYWVINQGLIRYEAAKNQFTYRVTYDYVSRDGTTTPKSATVASGEPTGPDDPNGNPTNQTTGVGIANPADYLISPMQIFCLQANGPTSITLSTAKLAKFGEARMPKSAARSQAGNDALFRDWFAVEAYNNVDNTSDRTSVVFRRDARAHFEDDPYDTRKGLTKAFEEYQQEITDTDGKSLTTNQKQDVATGILYTKSSDDISLLGNAVPYKTKELALYLNPPVESQKMTLKFFELENLEAVPGVWLIDRKLDNKTMKLEPGDEYEFVSDPADAKSIIGGNRFILRFYDDGDDIIGNNQKPISAYYNNSTLYVSGLNEGDINSDVQIYDMQGRLMGRTKINNLQSYSSFEYVKPLSLGTYIVKITGKRNYTSKIVSLQHN